MQASSEIRNSRSRARSGSLSRKLVLSFSAPSMEARGKVEHSIRGDLRNIWSRKPARPQAIFEKSVAISDKTVAIPNMCRFKPLPAGSVLNKIIKNAVFPAGSNSRPEGIIQSCLVLSRFLWYESTKSFLAHYRVPYRFLTRATNRLTASISTPSG